MKSNKQNKLPKNSKNNHKITQAKFLQFPNLSLVKYIQTTFPDMFTKFSFYSGSSKFPPIHTHTTKKNLFFESRSSLVS